MANDALSRAPGGPVAKTAGHGLVVQWSRILACRAGDLGSNPSRAAFSSFLHFTTQDMGRSKDFVSKEEFIEILEEEDVTTYTSYRNWREHNHVPHLPSNPNSYYNNFSWSEIGPENTSKYVHRKDLAGKEEFIEALKEKGVTTEVEYREWRKENDTSRMPHNPRNYYDEFSWDEVGSPSQVNNPIPKSRFIQILEKKNVTTVSAYWEWRKENNTTRMPSNPNKTYDGFSWKNVGDSGLTHNPYSKFRFINILEDRNITTRSEYREWRKKNDTSRMPSAPLKTYEDFSWDDVGGPTKAENPVTQERFIEVLENKGVTTHATYQKWREENDTSRLPSNPHKAYKDFSWHDIGEVKQWKPDALKRKIQQNSELYESLPPEELLLLLQEMGGDRPAEILESVTGTSIGEALRVLSEDPEAVLSMFGGGSQDVDLNPDQSTLGLSELDAAANQGNLDPETRLGQRIIRRRVNLCWQLLEQGESPFDRFEDGPFSKRVKEKFSEEYEGALRIRPGDRWTFGSDPNLMQRRTAYLLSRQETLINFSDVGTGKTLSAVLSAQVVGAEFTVVLCPASLRDQWAEEIENAQSGAEVLTEIPENLSAWQSYLVMSYEKLETKNREQRVFEILAHEPDFLVFDEVQRVKQRSLSQKSNRRKSVEMLTGSSDAKILALSALPVINNTFEGIKLLDLIGEDTSRLESRQNVDSALQLSHDIHKNGIRHEHHLDLDVEYKFPTAEGHWDPEQVLEMAEMGILAMEQFHVDRRFDAAIEDIRSGTIVYTHYVDDIIHSTKWRLERNGLSVGLFTGDDKSGLDPFREGRRDVLLASRPISEGVEGLQHQADTIVFLSLPWTSARLDQTIGRLARSGFKGNTVNVIVPQVEIDTDVGSWSWCEARWEFVKSKRMLIDTILTGEIPEDLTISQKKLLQEARRILGDKRNESSPVAA